MNNTTAGPSRSGKQHAPTAETEEVQHFGWYHRCSQQHQAHRLANLTAHIPTKRCSDQHLSQERFRTNKWTTTTTMKAIMVAVR
ncbi:hypothetical protein IFM47457_05860 [Aspergillus lentulus]|nr:hypothetical protein IFM47457_05860 [Aspergillus lentulus]